MVLVPTHKSKPWRLPRTLPRSLWPLALSVAVHLAVALPWISSPLTPQTPLPVGHWVEMVPGIHADPNPRSVPKPKQVPPSRTSLQTNTAAPKPAGDASPRPLGNTDRSTGLTGPLGDTQGTEVSVRRRYLYELEAYLNQHKHYPPRARHLGLSGRVDVEFHLHGDGRITDPHVVRPCIHDLLNRAAVDLVERVGRFRPLPSEIKSPVLHVTVPIQYELN